MWRASSLPLPLTQSSSTDCLSASDFSCMNSMSAPTKKDTINVRHHVRDDFEGNVNFDVSFLEFIKNVYGITNAEIEAFKNRDWKEVVDDDNLRTYQRMVGGKIHEPEGYEPFRRIVRRLVNTIRKNEAVSCYFRMVGSNAIGNKFTIRKPDGFVLWDKVKPQWEVMKVAIEMKRNRTRVDEESIQVKTSPDCFTAAKPSSRSISIILPLPEYLNRLEDRGNHSLNNCTSAGPPTYSGLPPKGSPSRKRSRSPEPTVANKRLRPSRLTIDQTQIANYALESMASACHRWTVGIMVDNFYVTVWYCDRMGAIVTEKFDFVKSLWKLALLVLALARCTPTQAGFEPLIVEAGTEIDPTTGVLPFDRPLASVVGAEIILPTDIKKLSKDDPRYTIVAEALYIYRGTTGRGTIVYPVKPAGGPDPGLELVVKWSWPLERRAFLEYEFITRLRQMIPWMKEHLPEVMDHREFTIEDLDLPRHKFDGLVGAWRQERRKLTILVLPRYKHLWEVESITQFQDVFVDLVECHYHAYCWANVLHRDLSENNLMWKYSSAGVAKGILNDWDLSSEVHEGDVDPPVPNCRTGTTPFMACELLVNGTSPPSHLYRHDLESFLYILIWAMVHYNIESDGPELPRRLATNKLLSAWEDTELDKNAAAKQSLLNDVDIQDTLITQVRPVFTPLIDTWLHPLLHLFHAARSYRYMNRRKPNYDDITLGGLLTFEKFMETLGRTPRGRPLESELVHT